MDIRTLMLPLAASATLLVAPLATAHDDDYAYAPRTQYVTARVERVEPIIRTVRVSEPRRECWDETYVETEPSHRGRYDRGYRGYRDYRGADAGGSALLGGLIGGVIGHQFGNGNGRDAATVAGALIGASVAHERALYRAGPRTVVEHSRTRTRCADRYDEREEERVTGYRVTYYYDGLRYVTRMDRDPGSTVRVAISARVIGD